MTDEHKAALAEGRAESRAVKNYVNALDAVRPKRGRKRTKESIEKRLATIDADMVTCSPFQRLQLVQERIDLTNELNASADPVDLSELEAAFVQNAKGYSQRKGIGYAAFRELGVSSAVLSQAGITRGS